MSRFTVRSSFAGLLSLTIGLAGCDGSLSRPSAFDITVGHLQSSNIKLWADGRRGTNRWVGEPEDSMPVIDVVVPEAHSADEAPIAAAAHRAVAEVNLRMAGLLRLREVPAGSSRQPGHIEISYLSAYVPLARIDDSAYCSNVSEARGEPARFRPGPDGRRNHGTAWVNLGNGHCSVRTGMVVHQLATALGLDAPFQGFEANGPAAAEPMWEALATLYANPAGTAADALRSPPRDDTLAARGLPPVAGFSGP